MTTPHKGIGLIPSGNALSSYTIASISFTGTGDNTLVASVANKTIRVFRLFLVTSAATVLIFKDGSTALNGGLTMGANGGLTFDLDGEPWFTASAGNAFILNQSGTATVGGRLWYAQS